MSNPNDPNLLDHEIDGIRELDNLLPRWWVWLFKLTTLFAVLYLAYYHVFGIGDSQSEKYVKEMAAAGVEVKEVDYSALAFSAPSEDSGILKRGSSLFITHCVACHLDKGQGLVGPNLTDDYWIHGGEFADTMRTITEGVPAKGMITWKNVISPNDIYAVASHIYTLRGSNPPNPKAPEGQRYVPGQASM